MRSAPHSEIPSPLNRPGDRGFSQVETVPPGCPEHGSRNVSTSPCERMSYRMEAAKNISGRSVALVVTESVVVPIGTRLRRSFDEGHIHQSSGNHRHRASRLDGL